MTTPILTHRSLMWQRIMSQKTIKGLVVHRGKQRYGMLQKPFWNVWWCQPRGSQKKWPVGSWWQIERGQEIDVKCPSVPPSDVVFWLCDTALILFICFYFPFSQSLTLGTQFRKWEQSTDNTKESRRASRQIIFGQLDKSDWTWTFSITVFRISLRKLKKQEF